MLMRILQITLMILALLLIGCKNQADETDALKAAEHIHSLITKQDYSSIYKESSDSFKAAGDETRFVEAMQKIHSDLGTLQSATPVAFKSGFETNVGRKHELLFDLQYERGRARERMEFMRSRNGQTQLWDLVIE